MKIAFVNDSMERLGVKYLSAMLKREGHEVRLFFDPQLFNDVFVHSRKLSKYFDYKHMIINDLKEYKPDLIGFSIDTLSYQWACNMAVIIKKTINVPIIFGGVHPTSVPDRVIANDFVDFVCVGEGEYSIVELVKSLEKKTIDYSIKNIWFKNNGEVIKNDVRPLVEDLDLLPFPDKNLYSKISFYLKNTYETMTSRGCPYSCSYCSMSYYHQLYKGKGSPIRLRSVANVIEELCEIKNINKKIKRILFADENFGCNINWIKEFSQKYTEKIGIDFFCKMHPRHITGESVEYLKTARCRSISLGIQTWNEEIRENLFNRKVSDEIMKTAINLILNAKIELLIDNIYDFPGYGDEDLNKFLDFYTIRKPTRNYFYRLHYYPNTILSQKAVTNKWLTFEEYENALDGKELGTLRYDTSKKNINKGKDKKIRKIQLLYILIDLIPAKLTFYIIRKKLYRFFPSFFNPTILTILRTLVSRDFESRYFRSTVFARYYYFAKKKVLTKKIKGVLSPRKP